jgi:hypothetical protein
MSAEGKNIYKKINNFFRELILCGMTDFPVWYLDTFTELDVTHILMTELIHAIIFGHLSGTLHRGNNGCGKRGGGCQ